MAALDTFAITSFDAVLTGAAALLNGVYLPAATPTTVAAALASIPVLVALLWGARRVSARPAANTEVVGRIDELSQRLQTTELLLADASGETLKLRQRVDELAARQETLSAGSARSGLRQAIALSKHGATTRQLIDTCDLSQGEAHLIQTLYGRPPGAAQSEDLH
jgi:hypothetical protein